MSDKVIVQIIAGNYSGDPNTWYLNCETLRDLFQLQQNTSVFNWNTFQTPPSTPFLQCMIDHSYFRVVFDNTQVSHGMFLGNAARIEVVLVNILIVFNDAK